MIYKCTITNIYVPFYARSLSNMSCTFQSIRQEHKRTAGTDEMCSNMLETLDGIVDLSRGMNTFSLRPVHRETTLQDDTQIYSPCWNTHLHISPFQLLESSVWKLNTNKNVVSLLSLRCGGASQTPEGARTKVSSFFVKVFVSWYNINCM